ncbi:MAG: TatD family hydrolase [Candidatus Doudnabacteria bacterium]|nr:TatD family hydrolase [Candidatus Doudnabacteria bacterium]
MRIFDTHTHLNFPQFDADRDQLIKSAQANNLWMTNVGCDYKTSKSAVDLASKYEKGIYATIGQHPTDSKERFNEELYGELITTKVVAVGECGLDYYHEKDPVGRKLQADEFVKQIHFAQKHGLPLVIHCRDAYDDLMAIMKAEYKGDAIIHSFTDSWSTAKKFLDMGFFIALNAILIFDKTGKLAEVAKNLPSDRILVETDAPFLSPIKGERNQPAHTAKVIARIAELRGETDETLAERTYNNACAIYKI